MQGPRSILYLAPTFLANRTHKQIRGVQIMDFQIVSDLVRLQHNVCVPIERTWVPRFAEQLGPLAREDNLEIVTVPALRKPLFSTLAAAFALRNRRFDAAILGNVARGVVPGIDWMLSRRVFERLVIQANAAPKPAFVRALRRWPARIVAVSAHVASAFPPRDDGSPVEVYYGIANPDLFFPAVTPRQDGRVRFCMLGKLDTALKGVDSVVNAFNALDPSARDHCELHLASFPEMPSHATLDSWGRGVTAHPWMPASDVPAFLRTMDALVIASSSETYSQACVQAMLTGLPVVARDLPALRERLEHGAGMCFENDAELANCMSGLATDAFTRTTMGQSGRAFALAHCVWSTREFLDRFVFPIASPTGG